MAEINTGMPQDSVLGPFFFLVYVNDLARCSNFNTLLYADDSVLTLSDEVHVKLKSEVETKLLKVCSWYDSNMLTK